MDAKTKKYLLMGGAALIAVLVIASRSGGGSGGSSLAQSQAIAANVDTTVNGQAYAYNAGLAANAADIAKAQVAAGSSEHIALLQTVGNIIASNNATNVALRQSSDGVTKAQISANANMAIAHEASAAQIASAPAEEATAIALAHINNDSAVQIAQANAGALSGAENNQFDLGLLKLGIGAIPAISSALQGIFGAGSAAASAGDLGSLLGVPITGTVADLGSSIGDEVAGIGGDIGSAIFG